MQFFLGVTVSSYCWNLLNGQAEFFLMCLSWIFISSPAGGVCLYRQDGHPHPEQHGVHRVLHRWLSVQVPGCGLRAGRVLCHRWTCEQTAAESRQGGCCGVSPSVVKMARAATYGHYIARCSERPFTGHPHTSSLTCQHKHSAWRREQIDCVLLT